MHRRLFKRPRFLQLIILATVLSLAAPGLVTPAAAATAPNQVAPASMERMRTATPQLAGSNVTGVTNYGFKVFLGTTEVASVTGQTSPTWTVPSGTLLDGETYGWQISATDGSGTAWSPLRWFVVDLRVGVQPTFPTEDVGPVQANLATGNVFYRHVSPRFDTAGGPLGLTLSYNSLAAAAKAPITRVLPAGWNPAVVVSDGLRYVAAARVPGAVTLYGPNGEAYNYYEPESNSNSYKRPRNDDATVTVDEADRLVVHGIDGTVYIFDDNGVLSSATSPMDRPNRTSPIYATSRPIGQVTDPVTSRSITLRYGPSGCPTPPSGLYSAPSGLLCEAAYWDGTSTKLFYTSSTSTAQLARIEEPGGEITDLEYSNGILWKIRDHLANDAIAASQRTDGDAVKTVMSYQTDGKISAVTLPAPTAGASQPAHSYSYTASDATEVDVAGLSPSSGYARRVTFWAPTSSMGGQITSDTDATGQTTDFAWHTAFEAPASVVDPAGMKTTWAYDGYRRTASDVYGPALADCFAGLLPTTPPTTCAAQPVPRTKLAYDGGSTFSDGTATNSAVMNGPAVTYWNNYDLAGDPVGFATGVGNVNGYLDANWGTGAPASLGAQTNSWSARFEGVVTFPSTGAYTFRLTADDGVRFWINDTLYASGWSGVGSPWTSDTYTASANDKAHIRVDYYEITGSALVKLEWDLPGGTTTWAPVALRPGYGLTTATTDPDGKQTATEYLGPETGQVTAQVADPAGLNLRTVTSYESSPGTLDPYKRPRGRTLPGASSSSAYTYYASGDTAPTSGCSGVSTQTGFAKQYTGPGSTPVQTRSLVDIRGRIVASQHVGDAAWNCNTYDTRGRLTQATDHAGGTIAQNDYSVAGQVTTNATDSYGRRRTAVTKWDLLGRVISYQDEHGTITTGTYDQAGRVTATHRTFAGGSQAQLTGSTYDDAGRLTQLTEYLAGTGRTTTFGYDVYGRPTTTSRPNSMTTNMAYDPYWGQVDYVRHKNGSAATVAETLYDRLPSGAVSGEFADVPNDRPFTERSFTYDGANRLTSVVEELEGSAPTTRWYRYDSRSNRCSTSSTVTNCSDTAYEYNSADQLTQSPFASSYDWDDQNNRPGRLNDTVGANGHPSMNYEYDARDHTTVIDDGSTKVEETLTPSGRVVRRKVTDTAASPDVITEDLVYGYADGGDSPAYVRDQFTDDWNTGSGSATIWNGSSWNADSNSTSKKIEIQGNEGAIWVSSASTSARANTKVRQNADVRLDYRFGSSSASSELRVGLRSTGTSNPNNASYRVDINPTSSTIRLRKKVSGASSATQLTSFTYSANTNGTPDKLRFRVTNDVNGDVLLQVKLWEGATEPGTWNLQYPDTAGDKITGAGTVEIAHSSSSATNTAYIDNLTFTDATGSSTLASTTTYIAGRDALHAIDIDGNVTYQHVNARGDIVGTSDSFGFAAAAATDEFGKRTAVSSSRLGWLGAKMRFTAHAPTISMRMGERIYDPALGRFTSVDPVEAGSLNGYEYAGGEPVGNCDVSGRSILGCEKILVGNLTICWLDYEACMKKFNPPMECSALLWDCVQAAFDDYRICRGRKPSGGSPGLNPDPGFNPHAFGGAAAAAAALAAVRGMARGAGPKFGIRHAF